MESSGMSSPRQRESLMPRGVSILALLALVAAAFAGLSYIQDVFTPVFLALTLVLTVRPIAQGLVNRGAPPWFAAIIAYLTIVVTFTGAVSILVWAFTPVPQTLVNYSGRFEETINAGAAFLESLHVRTDDLMIYANQLNFNSVVSWAWGLFDSLRSLSGLVAVVLIALFFMTLDTTVLTHRSEVLRANHPNLAQALNSFEVRVRHYWLISTVFGLVVAVIDTFALSWLHVPLPLTWGVWAFITNYIPNVGFLIGVIPPMLMALLDSGWQTLVWVIVLYSLINVVIQTFIQPKLTGDVVGLSPSITFISLVIWTAVVGLLGSILAVPLTLFFKALVVDSDPRTRWVDVFFVSESDAKRRQKAGLYDSETSDLADDLDFPHPSAALPGMKHAAESDMGKKLTNARRSLARIAAALVQRVKWRKASGSQPGEDGERKPAPGAEGGNREHLERRED